MQEVLITGASSGIGEAAALLFSQKGWKVYLLGRSQEKLVQVQKKMTSSSEILVCDVSKTTDCESLDKKLRSMNTNITCLVNNAGIYKPLPFGQEPIANWMTQFETNLFGAVRLTKILWPQLVKNKGSVVNVSSTLGLRPVENTSSYSASKAAMNSWTQTLALEGGPFGVRANAICPGLTDTPIHFFHQSSKPQDVELRKKLSAMQPLGRMGDANDIAESIYFVASPQASWMTGALIPVDGGVITTTRDP